MEGNTRIENNHAGVASDLQTSFLRVKTKQTLWLRAAQIRLAGSGNAAAANSIWTNEAEPRFYLLKYSFCGENLPILNNEIGVHTFVSDFRL